MSTEKAFIPLNIAVLTISDSRTEENDKSGQVLVERLRNAGHSLADKKIVPDNIYDIRSIVSQWIADPVVHAVVTTGGTGVTGRDGTPEAVKVLLDKQIEGFGELFRMISYQEIKTSSLQSRALAGVANGTYIFCLPSMILSQPAHPGPAKPVGTKSSKLSWTTVPLPAISRC